MLSNKNYEVFNLRITNVVVEQAQISREDIYAFLNGFDSSRDLSLIIFPLIKQEGSNAFYAVGFYIREKFLPVG